MLKDLASPLELAQSLTSSKSSVTLLRMLTVRMSPASENVLRTYSKEITSVEPKTERFVFSEGVESGGF